MRRIGYFLAETIDPVQLDRFTHDLKEAGVKIVYADNTIVNYKERSELRRILSEINSGDHIVFYSVECLGTTIREISRNIKKLISNSASYEIYDDSSNLRFEQSDYNYIIKAHDLLLYLSRYRTQKAKGAARQRQPRKKSSGRPTHIHVQSVIEEARVWIRPRTTIKEIQDKWGISRASAYRLLKVYKKVHPFDIERERFTS